nr:hypothetical protein [Tanacetum cinerariifolium]
QTPSSEIFILLAVGTPSTGSGNLYCQWELSPGSGNALCILFPTDICQLVLPIDEIKFDYPILNLLLDKVVSDVDMLRPRVLYIIAA